MNILNHTLNWLQTSPLMLSLISLILIDIILGSARAIIDKRFNSSIGKKGIIMKITMILVACCSVLIDYALNINFLFLIPEDVSRALNLGEPGLCEIIILSQSLYELTSICKHWSLLGLPGASKLEKLLKKFTDEIS